MEIFLKSSLPYFVREIQGNEISVKNTDLNAYSLNIEEYDKGINDEYISSMEDVIKPPTIAVLPFKNMSNDEEQEYFADGITEDIISNLSKWKTFPVVSRNSIFSFK